MRDEGKRNAGRGEDSVRRLRLRVRLPKDSIRVGALARVPKDAVDMDQVLADLKVRNGAYWAMVKAGVPTEGVEPFIELFRVDGDYVYVPRHYKLPLLRGLDKYDVRPQPPVVDAPSHQIKLRDDVQREASETLSSTTRDKIISLACGKGKSVIALHAAAEGERFPLLIVVNTRALLRQWKKEIAKFYGISVEDVGHVQGARLDWEGRSVAVGMLHTVIRHWKFTGTDFYKYWRTIAFDECHRLGSEQFSHACTLFPGERWGLSATVERADKNEKVFKLHLGRVSYENLDQPLKPKVYFIDTGITVDEAKFIWRGRFKLAQLTTWLSNHKARNAMLLDWIHRMARKGRTILVLGERVAALYDLCDACEVESKAVHVGSMDDEERAEALTKQVVFATQHLAKEGLNRPEFDTLINIIPFGGKGRLRQTIGRILRELDGKKPPKVLVFVDQIGICQALANKMRNACFDLEYDVYES